MKRLGAFAALLSLAVLLCGFQQETIGASFRKTAGGGAKSFVQSCSVQQNSSGANDINCTFGVGTTAGSGVAVYVEEDASSSPTTGTTDFTGGGTYNAISTRYDSGDNEFMAIYLATSVTPGTTTITFKCSTNSATLKCVGYHAFVALEIANATGSDATGGGVGPVASGTTTNGMTCASMTTATNGDIILFGATDIIDYTSNYSGGTSPFTFTFKKSNTVSPWLANVEYGTQTTAGAVVAAATSSINHNYDGVCAAIK